MADRIGRYFSLSSGCRPSTQELTLERRETKEEFGVEVEVEKAIV